jgi:hypothetical protein
MTNANHIDRRSFRTAKDFIKASLAINGFVYLDGGLSVVLEEGRRKFFQVCPRCSGTQRTDDTAVAQFVREYGCIECRMKESEKQTSEVGSRRSG